MAEGSSPESSAGLGRIAIRWSEHEARKPYARPFGITFVGPGDAPIGSIAVSGHDLLYYRQFQTAVLNLAGDLFVDPAVDSAANPQRAWLDAIAGLVPAAPALTLLPQSHFDDVSGRSFTFRTNWVDREWTVFSAAVVLDYQEFQAALVHQAGRLFRDVAIEAIDDDIARQRAWVRRLGSLMDRPDAADALAPDWPWTPSPGA